LLLFIGSGCAALIYEVVWFQLLQLSIGSSTVSLSVLLGVFMGGMCLGSLLLPRFIDPKYHPLKVYALLELGIGVFGVLVLFLVPFLGDLYTSVAGSGTLSVEAQVRAAGHRVQQTVDQVPPGVKKGVPAGLAILAALKTVQQVRRRMKDDDRKDGNDVYVAS
jgi:predicted membrane-bound spermidine synthase